MRISYHERQGIAMEENNNEVFQPTPPRRRRRRSKWQNFKEAYLPAIIAAAALILIIVFIVGSVKRSNAQEGSPPLKIPPSAPAKPFRWKPIRCCPGLRCLHPTMTIKPPSTCWVPTLRVGLWTVEQHEEYRIAMSQLVDFTDVEQVPVLGFNLLMADLPRSLADETYGSKFNQNYVTTGEFRRSFSSSMTTAMCWWGCTIWPSSPPGLTARPLSPRAPSPCPKGRNPSC